MAVIWAGMPAGRTVERAPRRARPVQWVGDVSYSLYLWHWPIFMFTPYITGVPSPPWLMALLVVVSLAVAGLSKRWIEDPSGTARTTSACESTVLSAASWRPSR